MRPVKTTLSLSDSRFASKILGVHLTERVYEHQELRLLMTHTATSEQEGYVPDFSEFAGQNIRIDVEDQAAAGEGGEQTTLFDGFVSQVSLGYEPHTLLLEVTAVSGSANLDEVPRTRLFQDVTLQELIQSVVSDYQGSSIERLELSLGALAGKSISFAAQWAETDWRFLLRLARKFGLLVIAQNRDIHVLAVEDFPGVTGRETPVDLELGHDLSQFRLGLRPANLSVQTSSYQPFGENGPDTGGSPDAVRVWTGPLEEAAPASSLGQQAQGCTWGSSPQGKVVEGDDHFSQQEYDVAAARWSHRREAGMVGGGGETDALGLGVGSCVHIVPAGTYTFDALAGSRFLIVAGSHSVNDGVYSLDFEVCDEEAPLLLDPADTAGEPGLRLLGATVTVADDPSRMGRVKAKLNPFGEDVLADEIPVRVLAEASGDGHGTLNLPEIGDEVVLALDPRRFAAPTALGSIYNGVNKTLVDNLPGHASISDGQLTDNDIKYYLSKAGTCVIHDATSDNVRLIVATPSISLVMSEQDGVDLHVRGNGGECQITGTMDGDLTIKANNITIEAQQKLELKSGTDTEIAATANAKLTAGQNLEQQGGMQVKQQAGTQFQVQGGMNLKLQAAIIELN